MGCLNKAMVAKIFDIQKFSIHDGPGIRTLVFFKGCPLHCSWCSNPESQKSTCELMVYEQRCAFCGTCVDACPTQSIELVKGPSGHAHRVDRKRCRACGECVKVCPNDALRLAGREVSLDEVFSVILQDYLFYLNSNGGVTLGGGEPTMQPEFAQALLRKCKQHNIHTAIETCGYTEWNVFESSIEDLDLVLYDIKLMDAEKHRSYTGVSNERILRNAIRLLERDVSIVIRIPIIAGVNDSRENIAHMMEFLKRHDRRGRIQRVELLPYHKLGVNKYRALGRHYELGDRPKPSSGFLNDAELLVRSFGFESRIERI
jgi:glycyl-radical enzyme activating protein